MINYNDSAVRVNHENCALNVEHTRNNWIKNTGHYLDGQFAEKELRTTYDDPFFDALSFDMRVAHAGLNPTAEIEQQHEIQITSLKYIDLDRSISSVAYGYKERRKLEPAELKSFSKITPWFEMHLL